MPAKIVMPSRKVLRIAATSVGVVFLGAVGSGVWDRMGSDALDWTARAIITLIDALIGTYKDSIYREASLGFHEHAASTLYVYLLCVTAICIIFIVLQRRRRENSS